MTRAPAEVAESMSEATLLSNVRTLARYAGWLTYHTRDSRGSDKGFPDLALCRPPVLWLPELKTMKGKLTPEQCVWLEALAGVREVRTAIWRPVDWLSGEIERALV